MSEAFPVGLPDVGVPSTAVAKKWKISGPET